MKRTGQILKKAREEKGLSLHEIGLSLKISNKVLKAIEEGDESHLPAKTFLRGFVQSYANFLHLNSEEVLKVFYQEMGSTRPQPYIHPQEEEPSSESEPESETKATETSEETVVAHAPKKRNKKERRSADGMHSLRENKKTKTYLAMGLAIALVGLIIFTKKMIDKYSKEAEVPVAEVAQTMEGATPVVVEPQEEAVSVPETATPTTPPTTESTPSPSPTPLMSPAPTPVATATPTPTPMLVAKPSPTPTPTPTPKPSPSPTPSPTPVAATESKKPVELIVEALDAVEIEYSAPNGKPQKIRLTPEQVHTFKSKSGLKVNFSNGGAVNLILNGKEIGIPGDLGKPIKLSY